MRFLKINFGTMHRVVSLSVAIIALSVLSQSCVHDKDILGCEPENKPGTLTLRFNVKDAQPQSAATRATLPGENRVDDIAVWLFDKDEICISYHYLRAADQSDAEKAHWANGAFNIELKNMPKLDDISMMHVSANVAKNLKGGVPVAANQVGKTGGDIMALHTTKAAPANAIESPFPMGYLWDKTQTATPDAPITSPHTVSLGRTIARVNVSVEIDEKYHAGLKNKLKLEKASVTLNNMVEHGMAIFGKDNGSLSTAGSPLDCFEYMLNTKPVVYYAAEHPLAVGAETFKATTTPFYLNQRAGASFIDRNNGDVFNPKSILTAMLKVPYTDDDGNEHDDNFYKVEIYNTDAINTDVKYFIYPNRSYNLKLTIVGFGADGIKAEIDCLPWNVEDKGAETGKSFTLSNEEFVAYTNADANMELTIGSVSAFGKAAGTITASNGITVLTTTFPAYTTGVDIKIKMDAATTMGTVTVTQDGVSKTITVERRPQLYVWDEEVTTFADVKYTSVKPITATDFKIATAESNYADAQTMTAGAPIASTGNGFYFYTTNGFSLTATSDPAASSTEFIVGEADKNTRVLMCRDGAKISYLNHFYTGTFHKNNQTGERLIRQADNSYSGNWKAKVVSGAEWIVLDGNKANITWPNNGVDAEDKQLTSTSTYIDNGTANIQFRMGLTSRNTQTDSDFATYKPRYGMILVMYESAGVRKYHPIYVRQGEEEDYVFRTGDGYPSDVVITNRPAAKKIQVYNLTKNTNLNNGNESNGHGYTAYPTQVGALFFANLKNSVLVGVRPYTLTNVSGEMVKTPIVSIGSSPQFHDNNPCPTGYRQLEDVQPDGVKFSILYNSNDMLKNSNFRQSCFYDPRTGWENIKKNDPMFAQEKLYADGYFDRQSLYKTANAKGYATQDNLSNASFAASGVVLVNPQTLHSVFMPGNGLIYYDKYDTYDGKDMRDVGRWTGWMGIGHHSMVRYFSLFYLGGHDYYYNAEKSGYGSSDWILENTDSYKNSVFSVRCVKV